MRLRNHLLASSCLAAVALAFLPCQSRAGSQDTALQQALGSRDPLYKFTPSALADAAKLCAARDPAHAGDYVAIILRSGRNDADALAPSLVHAAISGLGEAPKASLIGAVVHAAVKATPSEVLDIVTAAVKASPHAAGPAIVTGAVTAVPHPEEQVTINVERRAQRTTGSDKQVDDKQLAEPAQKQLTLAEAIVQAALDADPTPGLQALNAAANVGLVTLYAVTQPPVVLAPLPPVPPIAPTPPASPGFAAPGPVSP